MQKIFTSVILAGALFASACSASSEKSANKEYVRAASKVDLAKTAFEAADYLKSHELVESALADVRKIVEVYPESAIALKVMTDAETLIGPVKYSYLKNNIAPSLKKYANKKAKELGIAWAVAFKENDFYTLASIIDADETVADDVAMRLVNECIANIKDPILKSKAQAGDFPQGVSQDVEKKQVNTSKTEAPKVAKIQNKQIFLSQAKTESALVAYDIRAIQSLRIRALQARADSKELFAEVEKLLDSAVANIAKISSPQIKDKAYAEMSVLLADAGLEKKAIDVARKVAEAKLFEGTFDKIAVVAGNSENYMDAIALASRMPEGVQKYDFLSNLASSLAKRGYFEASFSVAASIKDVNYASLAHLRIAIIARDSRNIKALTAAVKKVDVERAISVASGFENFIGEKNISREEICAIAYSRFAALCVDADKETAIKANASAVEYAKKIGSKSFAKVAFLIADNYSKLGDNQSAVNFIVGNIASLNDTAKVFDVISKASLGLFKTNPESARDGFRAIVDINPVRLAYILNKSGLSVEVQADILQTYLPSF